MESGPTTTLTYPTQVYPEAFEIEDEFLEEIQYSPIKNTQNNLTEDKLVEPEYADQVDPDHSEAKVRPAGVVFECSKCIFAAKSERRLRSHHAKKHENNVVEGKHIKFVFNG